jgi:phytoene dehydrogenase-like protein
MPAALDRSYDGIIIGAGHHGMVLGSYLAKCGLDILLVDRRLQYGGGLSTLEVTAPGFYHNLHSINHFHISETPWFKDLDLADRVTYITPRYELGQPHLDGSALVFGRDLEETLANVARFSKKDAATFREWSRCRAPSARRCSTKARSAGISWRSRGGSRSMSSMSCSRTRTSGCCFFSRFRCSAPGWSIRSRRRARWVR